MDQCTGGTKTQTPNYVRISGEKYLDILNKMHKQLLRSENSTNTTKRACQKSVNGWFFVLYCSGRECDGDAGVVNIIFSTRTTTTTNSYNNRNTDLAISHYNRMTATCVWLLSTTG